MTDAPRVAVVTGGSSGIGQAVSLALASAGYSVCVVGRNPQRLTATAAMLDERSPEDTRGTHRGLRLDVTNETDMEAMADDAVNSLGHLDLLVASAGLGKRSDSDRVMPHPTAELPLEEWQEVIDVNLRGAFLANRAALRVMRPRRSGHIINVGSSTTPRGLRGTPFGPAYCASKFALVGLTESLAAEAAGQGIRAHVVFPGPVATPLVDQTILARPFGGSIAAESFANTVLDLVRQPTDAVVVHPHVLPFRGAFGRRKGGSRQ